jgi:hypothetical protein
LLTPPDTLLTERELFSSSEEDETHGASVRSLLKGIVARALGNRPDLDPDLEKRFARLRVAVDDSGAADVAKLGEDVTRLGLSPSVRILGNRRAYAGRRAGTIQEAEVTPPPKAKRTRDAHPREGADFTCPRCGHHFTLRRSLGMHLGVCKTQS